MFRGLLYRKIQKYLRKFGIDITISHHPIVKRSMHGSKFDEYYLRKIVRILSKVTNIVPNVMIEVGANLGQDSNFLSQSWNLKSENVIVIEPISEYVKLIRDKYDFVVIEGAVSNYEGKSIINLQNPIEVNSGTASLLKHPINDRFNEQIYVYRLDSILAMQNVVEVDFLKIDVEGLAWEVIDSLGVMIENVKAIQIETEQIPIWDESTPEEVVFNYLRSKNFVLIDYVIGADGIQGDSIWVQKNLMKRLIYSNEEGRYINFLN